MKQMEVYNAELYDIREGATHSLRYCQTTGKRRDVWAFTDNQAAIMRVANLNPKQPSPSLKLATP